MVLRIVLRFVLNIGSKILFKLVDELRKIDKKKQNVVKESMNDDYIRNSYRELS